MSDDGEADPLEGFDDEVADRDGDPFAHLTDPDAKRDRGADREADHGPAFGAPPADEPGSPGDPLAPAGEAADPSPADGDRDDPADGTPGGFEPGLDLGEDAAERSGDPFGEPGGVFEEMDAGRLDDDSVWEELAGAEARGPVADAARRTYAEVSKHRFCEGCEHFAEPPGATCTHDGTEILEFVDVETVRVVDCPVVAERRALEREV